MSNAVIEAVVGLKVRIGPVPFGVRVSLCSRICQEMMRSFRADAYVTPYGRTQNISIVFTFYLWKITTYQYPTAIKMVFGLFSPNDFSLIIPHLYLSSEVLLLEKLKGGREHVRHSFCQQLH